MREAKLRKHADCTVCGKLIGHTGLPLFWTVELKHHGVKMDAVRRQDGLAALTGSPLIAGVMGTDAEMTETLMDVSLTLCEQCALLDMPVMQLAECGDDVQGVRP